MASALFCDRIRALRALGYTPRQLRFLRLVLRCGGVCVPRQYASHAGIAPGGRKCLAFFARLVRRGHAVRLRCGHNRAHVYHVHGGALEAAFGDDATRYRRAMSPALVLNRLMRLDAALINPDAASYATLTDLDLRGGWRVMDPVAGRADGRAAVSATGPRRLPLVHPVGIDRVGAIVFVCLITEASPDRFRRALQRLLAHLADIHRWELLVAFSAPLARLTRAYQTMVHEELESPFTEDDVQGLWRLFMCRRDGAAEQPFWSRWPGVAATGYKLFDQPRFCALYRQWMEVSDAAFEPLRSTAAADAIAAGRGRVTYRTLGHYYDHLVPVAGVQEEAATTMIPRRGSMPSRTASTPGLNPARFSLGPLLSLEAAGGGVLVARCNCKNSKQMPTERSCPCSRCRSVAGPVRSRNRSASGKNRGVNDPRLRSAKCAPCVSGRSHLGSRARCPRCRRCCRSEHDSGPATAQLTCSVSAVELASLRCSILREHTGRLKAPLAALAAVAALTRPATLQVPATTRATQKCSGSSGARGPNLTAARHGATLQSARSTEGPDRASD